MRGYFAIGVEGISKAMNVGSLFRTAHAFGAGFVFTVAASYERADGGKSDTSDAPGNIPFYSFPDIASMVLPKDCSLIGVELTDDAIELPSFRHPAQAAYVMGPERGELSPRHDAAMRVRGQNPDPVLRQRRHRRRHRHVRPDYVLRTISAPRHKPRRADGKTPRTRLR